MKELFAVGVVIVVPMLGVMAWNNAMSTTAIGDKFCPLPYGVVSAETPNPAYVLPKTTVNPER